MVILCQNFHIFPYFSVLKFLCVLECVLVRRYASTYVMFNINQMILGAKTKRTYLLPPEWDLALCAIQGKQSNFLSLKTQ